MFSWKLTILQTSTLHEKESLNFNHGFNNINTAKWWEIYKNNGFKSLKLKIVRTKRKTVMETKKRKPTISNFETPSEMEIHEVILY